MATVKSKKPANEQKVAVYLDRAAGGEDNYLRVGVNGRMFQVPRGKTTMVPRAVYDVIRRSNTAKIVTEAYMRQNEYAEKAPTIIE